MDERVKDLVQSIDKNRTQQAASSKDETRVMQAMLNDKDFKVDIYNKSGVTGQYSPYEESRSMVGNIIKRATNIPANEANELANNYEFTKQDASVMVGISKEFINTYMQTGRKMHLGGREKSNISIIRKIKTERPSSFPVKVGVNEDGTDKYQTSSAGMIPEHESIRVYGACPPWLKK